MQADIIKNIRKHSGLSIKDFADKIRVSPPTVSKWEKGTTEPLFINQKAIRAVFKTEINLMIELGEYSF